MFKALFSKKPVFDPALGDPQAKKFLDAVKARNVDLILSDLDSVRSGRWDDRSFYVDLICENLAKADRIGPILDALPDSASGNLIRGVLGIHLAWKARGSGTSSTVTDEGWKVFFHDLDAAARYLVRSGDQDKQDPTPFASLQTAAKGLQLEPKYAVEWLDEAIRRDPANQSAHFNHMNMLCEKWGGSHDAMFDFARAAVKRAPSGSVLKMIIYEAYEEYFLYYRVFEKNLQLIDSFIADQKIRDESLAVFQNVMREGPITHVSEYYPYNLAAWWFSILKMPEVTRPLTQKIGPYFTQYPWDMFYKDPAAAYHNVTKL